MSNKDNERLQNELNKMKILSGINDDSLILQESLLSRIAAILGISLATLGGALAQSPSDFNVLAKGGYDKETVAAMQHAMTDSAVVKKLQDIGIPDNNIQKAVKQIEDKYKVVGQQERIVHSEEDLMKWMSMGYHLTKVQADTVVDTIRNVAPQSKISEIHFDLGDNAFFQSGAFVLTQTTKDSINHILSLITKNGDQLVDVTIESSTDKQGISPNLQKTLNSLGYTADNKGLSGARNDAVLDYLKSVGVDSSIVAQTILFEQGEKTIDQNYRYVKVVFHVLTPEVPAPAEEDTIKQELKPTYDLIKTYVYKKMKGTYPHTRCKIDIGIYVPFESKCPGPELGARSHR